MGNDLISVIVPIYGVEQYLLRCVQSVQKQVYKKLEIILVDDGSVDRCPQICDELALADPRIRVIHKQNGGLGSARNAGLDIATGTFVTFVDGDDWLSPMHIQNLYESIIKSNADIVIGGHTAASTVEEVVHPIQIREAVYIGDEIIDEILLDMICPALNYHQDVKIQSSCCTNLYRMNVVMQHALRFTSERYSVAEDLLFNIDFLYRAKCAAAINETGYFYYENQYSTTRKYNPNRTQRTFNFYNAIVGKMHTYNLLESARHRIERCYLMKVRVAIRLIVLSDLTKKQKMEEIAVILNNKITNDVLMNHPIGRYSFAMRIWLNMMRRRDTAGVYYMIRMREAMRNQRLLKWMLTLIGIGR